MDGKEYKMMERILGLSLRGCHEQLSVTCNIRDYREEAGGGIFRGGTLRQGQEDKGNIEKKIKYWLKHIFSNLRINFQILV